MLTHLSYLAEGRTQRWYDWLTPWNWPRLNWYNDRLPRLFACACARRVWHWLPSEEAEVAIESAEEWADGEISKIEMEQLSNRVDGSVDDMPPGEVPPGAIPAGYHLDVGELNHLINYGAPSAAALWTAAVTVWRPRLASHGTRKTLRAAEVALGGPGKANGPGDKRESQRQCELLRDLFGNPFRAASIDPDWLTRTVTGLAQAAYEERNLPSGTLDQDRLAILADALEDAGCTDAVILDHCRQSEDHVRGCWLLDLLLNKRQSACASPNESSCQSR
jgi:hypothetical protein